MQMALGASVAQFFACENLAGFVSATLMLLSVAVPVICNVTGCGCDEVRRGIGPNAAT
jgi:hypothetical protein